MSETGFPLESFREAATHLRRPFTAQAVKFKMQATWPKDNPTGGLVVSYIDARLVVERLNLIVPHLWHDQYAAIDARTMLCRLTVDGITREDVGEGTGKALYSDALKRAAVKFGIGVSLYAIPKAMVNSGEHAKPRRTRDGMTLELTPAGDKHIRSAYARWLDSHGTAAFGDPLNHGDVDDAQGDTEVDAPTTSQETAQPPSRPRVDPDSLDALRRRFKDTGWTPETLAMQLTAVGAGDVSDVRAAMQALSPEQARLLLSAMNASIDEAIAAQEALQEQREVARG